MSGRTVPAGKLNRRFEFYSPNTTRGSAGGYKEGWTLATTLWGELRVIGKGDAFLSDKNVGTVTHTIRIRFNRSVLRTWRVTLSETSVSPATTREFRIGSIVNPNDGRREHILYVKEFPDGEQI